VPTLSVGLTGSLGVADRTTNLAGSDVFNSFAFAPSSINVDRSSTPFLANVEVNLQYMITQAIALKGFGGLTYDSSVPGIVAPTFSGPVGGFPSTAPTTSAGITFASETSYYFGGGVFLKF
jgi:hypothetical protein